MVSVQRIFDIPLRQRELFGKKDALLAKEKGSWVPYSTIDFIETADCFSMGLSLMGFNKGDTIAMISANRPEWNMADIGMLQIGVINVPIYTTLSEPEIVFILNDCGAKMVIAGDLALYNKIDALKSKVPSLKFIFTFDEIPGSKNWREIVSEGKIKGDNDALSKIKSTIDASDLATILYTSGTTGTPKGVMLSHNNIISNVISTEKLCPVDYKDRALSFLPLCHSYERMLTYLYMYLGVSIYYAESMDKLIENIKEVKPHVFSTVPRLLEKVFEKIMSKGQELKGIKHFLFFRAVSLGLRYELYRKNGFFYEFELSIMNKLIFSKWREALGGEVKVIVSGGAALQPRLARVFWSANIPVLEGYGLTETSPVIAVNTLEANSACFGTVGPVIKGVTVKIAVDGEILCKGPNIMMGYYKRKDLTEEVIDTDGWFHTGDIGTMVDNRFLKITDRKKEIFKTSGGKYIAPQALENKFKESDFIEQIMIIGEHEKFPAALIVPGFARIQSWCLKHEIPYTNPADMIKNEAVLQRIQKEVDKYNSYFGNAEQIKKFKLLDKEWTTANGELTATLKLRRKFIVEKYSQLIKEIYAV